jgi:hypothetical protein
MKSERLYLPANESYAYLEANAFMTDLVKAQAIKFGFDSGLLDFLQTARSLKELASCINADSIGLDYLIGCLINTEVIFFNEGLYSLSEKFKSLLAFQQYMVTQIHFASLIAMDIVEFFPALVESESSYMKQARLFELFDYSRAIEINESNLAFTKKWVNFTTALTCQEAHVCISHHDFSRYNSIIDIGGNSGEFAAQICHSFTEIKATVVDLPVVCEIGRENIAGQGLADRVDFCSADAMQHELPTGFDLLTLKSILHDWPEPAVKAFLANGIKSLVKGGTLLIYERAPINFTANVHSFFLLPMALFFRSYRTPEVYQVLLSELGCEEITVEWLSLETDFFMITAVKP